MLYLAAKALISGIVVAAASEYARRSSGLGGLIVSLPLVSLLTFIWVWQDTRETERVAELAQGAFWFFLPSMPMFVLIPWLLRSGWSWAATMTLAIAMTLALYAIMFWLAPRLGVRL